MNWKRKDPDSDAFSIIFGCGYRDTLVKKNLAEGKVRGNGMGNGNENNGQRSFSQRRECMSNQESNSTVRSGRIFAMRAKQKLFIIIDQCLL